MRVDIPIYEDTIISAVRHCVMIGKKPSLANVRAFLKEMIIKYGEVWTTEPTFDDFDEKIVVDFDAADVIAMEIAPTLYDKIY
jgi:hypothetical protein